MAKQVLECSFCGRKKPETNLLIAGINAHVCDRCIEQAHGIVLEELKTGGNTLKSSSDLILKKFLKAIILLSVILFCNLEMVFSLSILTAFSNFLLALN